MKRYIIVKPKTLDSKTKERISKNGDIVIEHEYPGDVRIIDETTIESNSNLVKGFCAAMSRIEVGYSSKAAIMEEIAKALLRNS